MFVVIIFAVVMAVIYMKIPYKTKKVQHIFEGTVNKKEAVSPPRVGIPKRLNNTPITTSRTLISARLGFG